MPRDASGQVVTRERAGDRTYALRFRAYGERRYVTLGRASDGWSSARAEAELRHVLADVERGLWQPPRPAPVEAPRQVPTFHEFASEWYAAREAEWTPTTARTYLAVLRDHLLPVFAELPLDQITPERIDRYRQAKLAEKDGLSANTINKSVRLLRQVLQRAVSYDVLDRNPVDRLERRSLRQPHNPYPWLDRAEHIAALLDAAGELDRKARADRRHVPRRAWLATLVYAGLRPSEAVRLRWRDVDLAGGRLRVRGSKTDAATRELPLLPVLRGELARIRPVPADPGELPDADALVFATASGRPMSERNLSGRVFDAAARDASAALVKAGHVPLPEGLVPYSLRHTYVSLRVALGDDLATIARHTGHASLNTTLKHYTHVMALDDGARERLRALVDGDPIEAVEAGLNGHHWAPDAPDAAQRTAGGGR